MEIMNESKKILSHGVEMRKLKLAGDHLSSLVSKASVLHNI